MRTLIIALAIAALASLAYLAWNVSTSTEASAPKEADPTLETPESKSELVTPRRMRSRQNVSEDTLADPTVPRPIRARSKPSERGEKRLQGFDTDGDGRISMEERANAGRKEDRARLDEQDPTRDEARKATAERRSTQWMIDADSDDDGVLSASEAELGSPRLRRILGDFDEADRDGDGAISKEELVRAAETWRSNRETRNRSR